MREGIPRKKQQRVRIAAKQTLLRSNDDRLLPPRAQRRKPQIPVEARLIRRVNPRWLGGILRFESKRVNQPGLPIVRALKFDFVTAARHHGEQPVTVRDAKWLQRRNRCRRQPPWLDHPHHLRERGIEDPREHHGRHSKPQCGNLRSESLLPFLFGSRSWKRFRLFP